MALTPQDIAEKEFAFGLRGYDPDEVRSFLHLVAAEVADGVAGADSGADSTDAGATDAGPATAGAGAGARRSFAPGPIGAPEATVEAAQILQRANAEAEELRRSADAYAETTRAKAQAIITAAEAAALRLVAEAHARIDQRLGSAGNGAGGGPDRGSSPTVDALGAEIGALVRARDEILLQLQVVRTRVLEAVDAAESDSAVPQVSS